jgi:8-oxo-dGTP pyrophosphatase MutT (NUDIX family)
MRSRPNEWDLPGGTLEENESHAEGVSREVLEETGLVIESPELIARKSGQWSGATYEFSYYRSSPVNVLVDLSEEHVEYEWHDPLVASTLVVYKPHLMGFAEAKKLVEI